MINVGKQGLHLTDLVRCHVAKLRFGGLLVQLHAEEDTLEP